MTQQAQQQSVLAWLKDAHAMEAGGVVTLTNHAEAAGDYPEMQAKLHEHAQTTRRHAELVEGCIERLGGRPSSLKEAVGAVASKLAGVANLPAQDTVVKNALGDLAAENFEIASYLSLIAAAEQVGDEQTASVCRQILTEEEAMAGWLKEHIPTITRAFLAKADEGSGILDQAKQAAKNVGEQGGELAGKVTSGDTRNALLVSGALLAGAGAALLVGKALQGGTAEQQEGPDEPVLSNADITAGVQPYGSADALPDSALDQNGLVIETVGEDAGLLMASELQAEETVGGSDQPELAVAPELHDGSQAEPEPVEDEDTGTTR